VTSNNSPVDVPPPIIINRTPNPPGGPSSWRKLLAFVLSLFLGLFVASGLASALDDSCALLFGNHPFSVIDGILTLLNLLTAVVVYALMGLSPAIPKRIVLPLLAFMALSLLSSPLAAIFYYPWILQYDLIVSCAAVIFGLALICRLQGGWKIHWPVVADRCLGNGAFSWSRFLLFVLLNLFVLLPMVAVYLGGCASLAVNRFTDGFMSLRPTGIIVQARKYSRDDGKTVLLFPMSHIADADFYRNVTRTIGTNSVALLEGVTDTNNLLTHGISYRRAANFLHLAEQHDSFGTNGLKAFRADVDVSSFSSNTIALLNVVSLLHSEGLNANTLSRLAECSPSPADQEQLLEDLLLKRNQHVLGELHARLPDANNFVIPWGAAHMAGLAREIQKAGFHLVETHDFIAIRFGHQRK